MGISPDVNKPSSRRPISIISSSSDEHERSSSIGYCNRELPDKKIVMQQQEKIVPLKFKYSRSTTVVSQCSTGKRIVAAAEWDGVFHSSMYRRFIVVVRGKPSNEIFDIPSHSWISLLINHSGIQTHFRFVCFPYRKWNSRRLFIAESRRVHGKSPVAFKLNAGYGDIEKVEQYANISLSLFWCNINFIFLIVIEYIALFQKRIFAQVKSEKTIGEPEDDPHQQQNYRSLSQREKHYGELVRCNTCVFRVWMYLDYLNLSYKN